MQKKRPLTLLEVILAILLLGFLLTGLFQSFRAGMKKNSEARELKQKVLQLELFQQKMKLLFANEKKVWIEKHPDVSSLPLFFIHDVEADPDFSMCGEIEGMLYLNAQKELCLVSWSEYGGTRIETLLDQVQEFHCRLFDPKTASWMQTWPRKKEGEATMVAIDLKWKGVDVPFRFFLKKGNEPITYTGP